MFTTEEIMVALLVFSAHVTIASLFFELPSLNLWLLSEYGKLTEGWYEYYQETKSDRMQSPRRIDEVRKKAASFMLELDEMIGMHSALTRKRNLFLGSWMTYVTICVSVRLSQKRVVSTIRKSRSDRIRREKLRA